MAHTQNTPSRINLPEQNNRRRYVLDNTDPHNSNLFRVMYNGTQSYYAFWRGCKLDRRMRRMASMCATIELDNRPVGIVHNFDFYRTGNINVTVVEYPSDPHPNTTNYLMPKINMQRFMFQIFAIEQTKKRLIAQVNTMPPGSSKLPISDAYTFTVDIPEETNRKESELALILCLTINEMRDFTSNDDEDKEDFYNDD